MVAVSTRSCFALALGGLASGAIDATLNADVSFYDYLNVHPDADFKLVAQTEDASHVAIPLRKGDASATLLALTGHPEVLHQVRGSSNGLLPASTAGSCVLLHPTLLRCSWAVTP